MNLSRESKFEEAAKIRDRISNLQQVMGHTRVIEPQKIEIDSWLKIKTMLRGLTGLDKPMIPMHEPVYDLRVIVASLKATLKA